MPGDNVLTRRIADLSAEGFCCSEIVMKIMLPDALRTDSLLLNAMSGLCYGMQNQYACGVLAAAACALSCLEDSKEKRNYLVKSLGSWFKDKFGSTECKELSPDGAGRSVCAGLIEETIYECFDLLEENEED